MTGLSLTNLTTTDKNRLSLLKNDKNRLKLLKTDELDEKLVKNHLQEPPFFCDYDCDFFDACKEKTQFRPQKCLSPPRPHCNLFLRRERIVIFCATFRRKVRPHCFSLATGTFTTENRGDLRLRFFFGALSSYRLTVNPFLRRGVGNLALGTPRPGTEGSRARNPKRVRKESERVCRGLRPWRAPESPKSAPRSPKRVQKRVISTEKNWGSPQRADGDSQMQQPRPDSQD